MIDTHVKMAESLIQTDEMMAITTLDAYELYKSTGDTTQDAKKQTMQRFLITSTELEKRLQLADTILNDPYQRSIYAQMHTEIQNHMDTINQLISEAPDVS